MTHERTRLLDRRATEIEMKTNVTPWRAWRCSLCANIFATLPFLSESSDGESPECCPYCGQIFNAFTEFE